MDQYIEKLREAGETLSEQRVWKALHEIANSVDSLPLGGLHPTRLRIKNDTVFCRPPFHPPFGSLLLIPVFNGSRAGFYDAPEILDHKHAIGAPALSWTLGCITYELTTLVPAYYDREGTGNMMKVVTDVLQAVPPPEISQNYSDDLKNLIQKCLRRDPQMRPTLEDIRTLAKEHVQIIDEEV